MAALFWLLATAHAATTTDLDAALSAYNAAAHAPLPALSADQKATLLAGDVVTLVEHAPTSQRWRVVGMAASPLPMTQLWMACVDPDASLEPRLSQARLEDLGPGHYTWYGLLDLPSPFSDRHWALEIWNNTQLATQTHNRAWEHPWALRDDVLPLAREHVAAQRVSGVDPALFDAAVALPSNDGGWAVFAVGDDLSVVVHHADTQLGGVFPDRAVARYVEESMGGLLGTVLSQAAGMPGHYTTSHPPILGGDNQPLPPF